MTTPPENPLVRKSDLNEAKADIRREIKLWVGIGLAGGQAAASLITAAITRMGPHDQVAALVRLIL